MRSRCIAFFGVWVGTWVCCTLAIAFFYGLGRTGTIIYPFRDGSEQVLAVLQTSIAATLCLSWVIWSSLRQKRSAAFTMLRTALWTEASFTVFALVGMQMVAATSTSYFEFIFHSTFFAEYNWLTFFLEVGPVTSCAAALFVFVAIILKRRELSVDSHSEAKY